MLGEPADGRGVGALVVVDDDDERQVSVDGDVVDRLPGHPAGQGAVTDDGDRVAAALTAQSAPLGDAVGPGQGRRGVGVLDDVVLGLGSARVPGQASLLLQLAEVVPSGQQLVHVGLVARVEDDRVPRRVEDAVQRDGELDDTEVGAEVPTGLAHLRDEEGADLLGERRQVGCR